MNPRCAPTTSVPWAALVSDHTAAFDAADVLAEGSCSQDRTDRTPTITLPVPRERPDHLQRAEVGRLRLGPRLVGIRAQQRIGRGPAGIVDDQRDVAATPDGARDAVARTPQRTALSSTRGGRKGRSLRSTADFADA